MNHHFITYMTTLLIVNPMLLMLVSLVVETRHWSWTMFSTFVPNNGRLRTNSHQLDLVFFHSQKSSLSHSIPMIFPIRVIFPYYLYLAPWGDIQWSMVVKFAESKPIEQWSKTPSWLMISSEVKKYPVYPCTGWWFGTFFIFPYIGNNPSHWLIFFRGVETTN